MPAVLHFPSDEVTVVLSLLSCRPALLAVIVLTAVSATRAQLPAATILKELTSSAQCNRCSGTLLRGRAYANPAAKWGIISDLPESFKGYGVLYSTRDVLPANGGAPELLRQRKANGFEVIDGSFDVFIFHLMAKEPSQVSRIVVHAKNLGEEPVTLDAMQVIRTEGLIGTVHEFESGIATRVLANNWDRPVGKVTLQPGQGRIVAYGKRFGNIADGPDASKNINCFGYVRCLVDGAKPARLQVDVVAIPPTEIKDIPAETAKWLDKGATSTDEVPMDSEPQGCELRRAVGVYPNPVWRNDATVIDVSKLPESGISFPMALPKIQTAECEDARQTVDLVLRPGYTREDTIGNYMMEYDVRLTFVNPDENAQAFDVTFRGELADIGLAYQLNEQAPAEPETPATAVYNGIPVLSQWAGPKQSAKEKPLLPKPIRLEPGTSRTVAMRFLIVGNSSLPFMLIAKKADTESGAQTPY